MTVMESKPKDSHNYLSEAVILALTSASAYYLSFSYEKSFLLYFGVPYQFVSLDLTTILSFAAIILGVLIFAFPALNMFALLLSRSKNEQLVRLIRPYWIFLFVMITFIYLWGLKKTSLLIVGLVVIVFRAFFDFIFPLMTQTGKKTYRGKLQAQERLESNFQTLPQQLGTRYGRDSMTLVVLLVIGYLIAWNAGLAEATRQDAFLFTDTEPPLVVIRVYSDRLICAGYDEINNEVLQRFSIIDLQGNPPVLVLRTVGPLHTAVQMISPSPTPTPTTLPTP